MISVSVNLLTYNAQRFIERCLASVLSQGYPGIEILIIDNDSQDGTILKIEEIIARSNPKFPIRLIKNEKNLGFSAGHNLGIKKSRGELVLCLNQDVILVPDFVEKAAQYFEKNKDQRIAAIQGKLLRLDKDLEKTDIFDTTGLVMLKNRRIINRGQGEKNSGQYDKIEEVFGADGAAPIYLREALEDIKTRIHKFQGPTPNFEYFDEDLFMYKEDVDLAWRLRLFGWKAVYLPQAVAWHQRGSGESAATNYISIIKERRRIGQFAKSLSFRNQRLMQIKNELPTLLIKHLFWFFPKEFLAWLYALLFEKHTLRVIKELIKMAPDFFAKRRLVMSGRRTSAKDMQKWFF